MVKKLIVGFTGGILYILITWGATLTGILDWLKKINPEHPMGGISMLAPFSLMSMCMFASIYAYHKWQPQEKERKTFGKLMVIGFSFALGATVSQFSLMHLDGINPSNSLILASIFFSVSILISLLICSFYLFIKPIKKNKNQDNVFD
jgi:uncharacterized BrkB/YihY/UPF0761 family membrane protein